MKKGKGGKSQTGTLTSEEINKALGGDIEGATKKVYDHYAGKTKKVVHEGSKMTIVQDIPQDPYKGISKKTKLEGDVDNTVAFDKKAYRQSMDED